MAYPGWKMESSTLTLTVSLIIIPSLNASSSVIPASYKLSGILPIALTTGKESDLTFFAITFLGEPTAIPYHKTFAFNFFISHGFTPLWFQSRTSWQLIQFLSAYNLFLATRRRGETVTRRSIAIHYLCPAYLPVIAVLLAVAVYVVLFSPRHFVTVSASGQT